MAKKAKNNILTDVAERVPIDTVKPYRKNPRVGNVEAIAESLAENGQFRPIIVQKTTGEILGGNHTWKAAKHLGWTQISAVFVDVDDERAKRIVLADNRTNDLATYDTAILQDIISGLPDVAGTGYDDDAVANLLQGMQEQDADLLDRVIRPPSTPNFDFGDDDISPERDNRVTGSMDDAPESPYVEANKGGDEKDPNDFENAPDQIQGGYTLKLPADHYEKVGQWHLPPLIPSMLATPDDIPRNLLAWAGSATKDWPDPDQHWLYNFGIDSTSGMHDISKCIMGFYCWDEYFEKWWDYPDRYVSKMLNSGIKVSLEPDFSQWAEDPKAVSLFAMYKNRWLARYMQEAGVKVVPNLSWRYDEQDWQEEIVLGTLPKKTPVVSMQLQTFAKDQTPKQLENLRKMYQNAIDKTNPELLILYVGKQGMKMAERLRTPGERLVIVNRMDALAEQAKKREKKKTF